MNNRSNGHSKLRQGLRQLLMSLVKAEPESREELVAVLKQARARHLMDGEALSMMEAVLQVSELRVRDIMIPRARMVVVERDRPMDEILPVIVESAHSRFPVIGDDRSEVVGILLAKDLLQYCGPSAPSFNMRDVLRSAVFVPESKRLNVLLKEFRLSRNHMAIVIDEYGGAAGLITIEDVLEQIVGEIEDEYDFDEGAYILKRGRDLYTAKAHTTIEDFNEFFHTDFMDDDYDTIGGMVVNALGHMPSRGEAVDIGDFRFTVVRADSRKVRLLNIERRPDGGQSVTTGGEDEK
ncbi:HlyC/CorC family transporter [Thiolapillus sp.]